MASTYDVDLSGAVWVKSKRSTAQGNNCVEVARLDGIYAVRDSKRPEGIPLIFTPDRWLAFLNVVKNDEIRST